MTSSSRTPQIDPIPRPRPLTNSAFLTLGQRFSGSQTVNAPTAKDNDEWRVNVMIQGLDLQRGTICGSMEALDVPKAVSPVVTFWRGEIIDNCNYFFWTGRWDAEVKQDVDHWKKFVAFAPMQAKVRRDKGDDIDMSCLRYTGAILGFYYDPQSQPYQRLQLNATFPSQGGCAFEDYEFN